MEISPLLYDEDDTPPCEACGGKENARYELEIGAFLFCVGPKCVESLRKSLDFIEVDE